MSVWTSSGYFESGRTAREVETLSHVVHVIGEGDSEEKDDHAA